MTKKKKNQNLNSNQNQNPNSNQTLGSEHYVFEQYPFVAVYSNKEWNEENLPATVKLSLSIINEEVESFLNNHPDSHDYLNRLFYRKNEGNHFVLPVYFAKKSFFLPVKGHFYSKYLTKSNFFGEPNEEFYISNITPYRNAKGIPNIISIAFSNYLKETPPDYENPPSSDEWESVLMKYKEAVNLKRISSFFQPLKKTIYFNNITYFLDKPSKNTLYSHLRQFEKNPYVKSGTQSIGKLRKCKHTHFNLSGNDVKCTGCGASMTYSKSDKAWKPNQQAINELQEFVKVVNTFTPTLESVFKSDAIHFLENCISLSSVLKAPENKKIRSMVDRLKNIIRNLDSLLESTTLPLEQRRMFYFADLLLSWTKNKQSMAALFEKENLASVFSYHETVFIEKVHLWSIDNSNCLSDLSLIMNEWQSIYDNAIKKSTPTSFMINQRLIFLSKDARTLLSLVNRLDMDFGVTTLVDVLKGSKSQKMKEYNLMKKEEYGAFVDFKKDDIKDAIYYFIEKDIIRQEGDKYPKVGLTKKGKLLLQQYKNLNTDKEQSLEADSINEVREVKPNSTSDSANENEAEMPVVDLIKEEEQKFYTITLNEFFERLTMPNLPMEWVTNYLEKHHEVEDKVLYRKVVEAASKHTKYIPFVEEYLINNYDEMYEPIFRMYLKTKTGLWKELVSFILDKHSNSTK